MMKKALIYFLMSAGAALAAETFETVKILTTSGKDKPPIEKTARLEKQPDGAMRLKIPAAQIRRGTVEIEVFHPAFAAKKGDNGYWLGNRGALGYFIHQDGKWRTKGKMHLIPIQAFKTGEGMFLAWIKGLRFEADSKTVAENGQYKMSVVFNIRDMLFDAYEDAVIDYYYLGKDAEYSEVGRFVREKLLKENKIIPLAEKMKTRPDAAYLADTFVTRISPFAAKPAKPGDQTPETEPPVKVIITTKKCEDIFQAFKDGGVEKMEFCLAGWTTGGYDGRYPSHFPVEPLIGGEAGLKALIEKGKKLGYSVACHTASTAAFKISPMWNEDYICKRLDGSLLKGAYYWGGGTTYRVCLERAWQLYTKKELADVKNLGVNGSHYIDVFSALQPYPCCDKNHPANRKQAAEAQRKIAQFCIDTMGGFASECGEDHLINEMTYINYVSDEMKAWQGWNFIEKFKGSYDEILPLKRRDEKTLIDAFVPLWEIVYHGFVYHNADRLTQNHLTEIAKRKSKKLPLMLVEFSAKPIFYINNIKSVPFVVEAYRQYKPLARLSTVFLDEHKIINESVRLLKYADGTRIIINYGGTPFEFEGEKIAPISYKILAKK